ncbi:MAG TPA: MFS transporter [Acidimicrobiales bacterium]|jgi:EmrB/QacA subfamily drug resistance transporter|nr:MFS transporter [Acidimicrobiales bacterium]
MSSLLDAPSSPSDLDGPDPKRWLALGIVAVAQLMVVLDASIVTIALPSAQHGLHISTGNRQWVITAYTLAFGGLLLLGGRIADYIGRKRAFIIGLIGFAGASALGGVAVSSGMLFGARALQGAFAALLAPAALSLITVTFTEVKERATAFGVYGAISGGGAAIGLILGGVLTEFASWRWCLLVNVPIAIVTALAAIPVVRESRAHGNTSYDIPGALTITLGLVSLVYGFSKAEQDGWASSTTVAFLLIAVALMVTFVVIELRSKNPLLPMRIILERTRGGSYLASFLTGAGLMGMFLFLTYYFQGSLHYSALKSGFAFLPFSAGIIVAAGVASRILPKVGPRSIMTVGLGAASLGMFWLTQIGVNTSFAAHVLPAELLISLGMGLAFVALSSTALHGVSDHDAGVASAMVNATQQVGGSLGTALLNTLAASATLAYVGSHVPGAATVAAGQVHGYSVGALVGGIILAAAAVAAFFLVKAGRHDSAPSEAVAEPVAVPA